MFSTCNQTIYISGKSIYYILTLLVCLATIAINMLTIIIFLRYRKLRSNNNNLLILSMSFADVLVPFMLVAIGIVLLLNVGKTVPIWSYIINPLCVTVLISGLTLIIMTVDRLIAVQKPLIYNSIVTKGRVGKAITCVWVFPICIGVIGGALGENRTSIFFTYVSFVLIIGLVVLVLIFSNALLLVKAIKASQTVLPVVRDWIEMSECVDNQNQRRESLDSIASSIVPFKTFVKHVEEVPRATEILSSITKSTRSKSVSVSPQIQQVVVTPLRARALTTNTPFEIIITSINAHNTPPPIRPSRSTIIGWQKSYERSKRKQLSCLICLLFTVTYIGCMLPVCIHLAGVRPLRHSARSLCSHLSTACSIHFFIFLREKVFVNMPGNSCKAS